MKQLSPGISKAAGKVNAFMLALKKSSTGKNCCIQQNELIELHSMLKELTEVCDNWLSKNQGIPEYKGVLELYFEILAFQRIWELFDESYCAYLEHLKGDVMLKLFCLNPSKLLKQITGRMGASVFFSATLTPLNYFKYILGGTEEDYTIRFPSPFPKENLMLAIAEDISTRYVHREDSIELVAAYIQTVVEAKRGNYLVFFPSYKYMDMVYELFCSLCPAVETVLQQPSMKEEDKEQFLQNFGEGSEKTLVGFAVMGGMFSEGIDLARDRLIGAVVVGVGLPQVCFERDIIMDYFKENNGMGFEYAYMYPGMNKVLQAAGRVIRSESDKGVVLLIDDRFTGRRYAEMFPEEWKHNRRVNSPKELERLLEGFWS